jgi:hypothetical protein
MMKLSTQQCRIKAAWVRSGTSVYYRPRFLYRIPCTYTSWLVEHLGAIQLRNDCRWNWWRWESKWHEGWTLGQGVADNQGAAELRVLEGWRIILPQETECMAQVLQDTDDPQKRNITFVWRTDVEEVV